MKKIFLPIFAIASLGVLALLMFSLKSQEPRVFRTPLTEKIYIAVEGAGEIATVDAANRKVLKRIDLAQKRNGKIASYMPHNVQVAPNNKSVWVTANVMSQEGMTKGHNEEATTKHNDEIIVLDPISDTVIKRIAIGPDRHLSHVALTPDSSYALVAAQEKGALYKINATNFQIEQQIETQPGAEPHGLRIAPDGKTAYIAMLWGKSLGVLDIANFSITYIPLKGAAVQTGITPDGAFALASVYDAKSLAVYDIASGKLNYIDLPKEAKGPVQLYPTADSRYVYVADQGYYFKQPISALVYKIDLKEMKVVKTISGGEAPHGVIVSRDGKWVYVTNLLGDDISVIDTATDQEVAKIKVGDMPNGISLWYGEESTQQNQSKEKSINTSDLIEARSSEIVELKNGSVYEMTASAVKKKIGKSEVRLLAYNGSIPGPLIKVKKGSTVQIKLTNNTNIETLLHSHGVRLDSQFDGTTEVQKPIGVGESFTYTVKFPDEGIYWYHPHFREDYAQELGLYGNFLVTPEDADYWSPVNREAVLVLDDILLENGQPAAYDARDANHALMGRFGNRLLVNGETNYTLAAKQGEVVRFYLTNTANTRVFNVRIPGVKLKLAGGDNGKYERETWVDAILLSPSERAVVEVLFSLPGSYAMEHRTPEKMYRLAAIIVSPQKIDQSFEKEFNTLRENKDTIASIEKLRPLFNKEPDKTVRLAVAMGGSMMSGGQHMMHGGSMMDNSAMRMGSSGNEKIEWEDDMGMMNKDSTTKTLEWRMIEDKTGTKNEEIDWKFKAGDIVKVRIINDKNAMHPMQHPIHFHGQRFLVVSVNGVPANNLVWKDTALVPSGDTVDVLVDMSNPGRWMAHCHIPEHLESNMMLTYEVK